MPAAAGSGRASRAGLMVTGHREGHQGQDVQRKADLPGEGALYPGVSRCLPDFAGFEAHGSGRQVRPRRGARGCTGCCGDRRGWSRRSASALLQVHPYLQFAQRLSDAVLMLYDVSSTAFERRTCTLVAIGYPRATQETVSTAVSKSPRAGSPAKSASQGNTGDPKTVASQVEKLEDHFGLSRACRWATGGC